VGRLFWKTCAGTAPSLRYIGRLQHSVLIKNGRCWRKHLSMSVSRGRSSKDTSLFAIRRRDGRWQSLRKAVPSSNVRVLEDAPSSMVSHCYLFPAAYGASQSHDKSDWRPKWWLLAPTRVLKNGSTGN
jgi:hypothetical protein